MKKLTKSSIGGLVVGLALAFVAVLTPLVPTATAACDPNSVSGGVAGGVECANPGGVPVQLFGDGSIFNTIVNAILYIVGIVCVIMIIVGGIRYATSSGDQAQVTTAKNTIMYAIIGLVVAILAYAIVNWVLVQINNTGA